jgi:hypothetical protein
MKASDPPRSPIALESGDSRPGSVAEILLGIETEVASGELTPEDQAIARGVRTILSVAPSIPGVDALRQEIEDAANATRRGCFLPDEDERVLAAFARYLGVRAALHSCISELEPLVRQPDQLTARQHLQAFVIAFAAACMLNRSAEFIVSSHVRSKVVQRKLDEPEPRLNLPPKQFTKLFKSLNHPFNIWRFQQSIRFAKENEEKILAMRDDPEMGEVVELLLKEKPQLINFSRRTYYRKRFRYWFYAYARGQRSGFKQVMAALFELSGRAISNVRNPFHLKRVTPEVRARIAPHLRPGDVIIVQHDDVLSAYLLPGFWTHAALYIGTEAERAALGIAVDEGRRQRGADPMCVLEANKEGVLFRPLDFTFRVDSFAIIRPALNREEIGEVLARALSHEGKFYDFEFDFRRADRLVCTELIYRSFHAIGGLRFQPVPRVGRFYIKAEHFLDLAIAGEGFEVVALYGAGVNSLTFGEKARKALAGTYKQEGFKASGSEET